MIKSIVLFVLHLFIAAWAYGQLHWQNVDTAFGPLPPGFHVYYSNDSLDGEPFKAYYAIADLTSRHLQFDTDTSLGRRLSPTQFYQRNHQPLLVVNSTFFSFASNQNLNLVIKNGKMLGYNIHALAGKGRDTLTYRHAFNGAIGISKKGRADIAWIYSDSNRRFALASQRVIPFWKDSFAQIKHLPEGLKKWKMKTAVAGGPVLLQNGLPAISNNEEQKFAGKAIADKHPRTLMGNTAHRQLIVMVIEGRRKGIAAGATLTQAAKLLQELGCVEALNLDGGGSSCMLINGKHTIYPSDKGEERRVPAVFIIK